MLFVFFNSETLTFFFFNDHFFAYLSLGSEGWQNMPPQNMAHKYYFELRYLKNSKWKKNTLTFLLFLKAGDKIPRWNMFSLNQAGSNNLIKNKLKPKKIYINRPCKCNSYLLLPSAHSLVTFPQLSLFVYPIIKACRLRHFFGSSFLLRTSMSHKIYMNLYVFLLLICLMSV